MFYALLALLAFATAALLAAPLFAWPRALAGEEAHAAEVYKAQLDEIGNDLKRGALSPDEAEAARAEIGRRLIAASDGKGAAASGTAVKPSARAIRLAGVTAVPLIALLAYAMAGRPDLAVQEPVAELTGAETPEQLVALAEARMRESPEDARGWDVLGRAYMSLGRFEGAGIAFERAIRHGGKTGSRLASLAETRIILAGGEVTAEARALLDEALALDPADAKSLSFIGLAQEQAGDTPAALATWEQLASLEGVDPRYSELATARMAALRPSAGPGREDVAAAAGMDEASRAAFIESMVEGLKARLSSEGGTLAEWKRLIRSQMVLGRETEAQAALKAAVAARDGDAAAQEDIAAFAAGLGLGTGANQ